jgi:hypothetical protein
LLVAGVDGKHGSHASANHGSHASDVSPNSNTQKDRTSDGTIGSASFGSAKDVDADALHPWEIPDKLPDDLLIGTVPKVGNPAVGIPDELSDDNPLTFLREREIVHFQRFGDVWEDLALDNKLPDDLLIGNVPKVGEPGGYIAIILPEEPGYPGGHIAIIL